MVSEPPKGQNPVPSSSAPAIPALSPEFAEEIDDDLAADAAESLQILRDPTGDLDKEDDDEGGIPLDPAEEAGYSRLTTQKIRALGPRPEKP